VNAAAKFEQAFQHARALHTAGRLAEAEQAYQAIDASGTQREDVLRSLVELYLQAQRIPEVISMLEALTEVVPDKMYYYGRLATVLEGLGRVGEAIGHYQRLLQRRPEYAAAYFNLALLYKKAKRYDDALAAYQAAINCGIDNMQEVYSNMGVLYSDMRQLENAREMYQLALDIDPAYIPAMFNLAGLLEETGSRQHAIEHYERILSINPRHWDSLARIAYAQKPGHTGSELIETLRHATEAAVDDDPLARESLYFALGKVLDDCAQYAAAFEAYRAANAMGKLRNSRYQRSMVEQGFDRLIELFSPAWIKRTATTSTASPVFICGMFRSGSTLVEQILAGHPQVTAGGELDYLPWLVAQKLAPFPERVQQASGEELEGLGAEYLAKLKSMFPDAECITDKRPDNFLYLGLIKIMFPSARIIYTRRNPLDNCLSVYFQQLGGDLGYATDLAATAHYYRQHVRLMKHWENCFGAEIVTLDYDELVISPEPVLRRLLQFLGLTWDDRCLLFHQADNPVKTASVWQVRDGLHTHSSGRWRNYAPFVEDIRALLE
jgi:tetratricopeptide (TPR) repeat protein